MANVTVYYDVANEPVLELDLLNKLNNCIFPISDGRCVKWTYEGGEKSGETA